MPHPDLVPPLPQDLQNRSFKGMDCAGWDFSGRDIRGCDFRKSNLSDADFTGVHTGRTQQQINRETIGIPIGLILGIVFGVMLTTAHKSPAVLTHESIDAAFRVGMVTMVIAVALMFTAIVIFSFLRLNAALMSMVGTFWITYLSSSIFPLINSSLITLPIGVVIFVVGAACSSGFGVFYYRQAVKQFHNAIGTDFQGANLIGTNFTDAILKNCAFKDTDTSQANWTNVSTSRCDRDVTKLA
jgi:Pentapeptide repeats (8 copies)